MGNFRGVNIPVLTEADLFQIPVHVPVSVPPTPVVSVPPTIPSPELIPAPEVEIPAFVPVIEDPTPSETVEEQETPPEVTGHPSSVETGKKKSRRNK